jgi:hypothetical protein
MPDVQDLFDQLASAEAEARALAAGLAEEQGDWRIDPGS